MTNDPSKAPGAPESDTDVELAPEIAEAAESEFKRLLDRLKKAAEEAKAADAHRPE